MMALKRFITLAAEIKDLDVYAKPSTIAPGSIGNPGI